MLHYVFSVAAISPKAIRRFDCPAGAPSPHFFSLYSAGSNYAPSLIYLENLVVVFFVYFLPRLSQEFPLAQPPVSPLFTLPLP